MKRMLVFVVLTMLIFLVGCNLPTAPTSTAIPTATVVVTPTPIPIPTKTPTLIPTASPTLTSTPTLPPSPTPIVLPTNYTIKVGDTLSGISEYFDVPLVLIALVNKITDTDLIIAGENLYIPDPENLPEGTLPDGKKILVVLSEQKVYVFENQALLKEFIVSTGLKDTPTVTGKYTVINKKEKTRMTGDGYDLADVPWVLYFYQGYSFHGTYWHNNFGQPMSHGCVNMITEDAKWLYDWSPLGTEVEVIP